MKQAVVYRGGERLTSVVIADTYYTRLRGLIGRKVGELGGLLLRPCSQIHTCLMSESIDAVYLDRGGRVVDIEPDIAPRRLCRARKAKAVLEIPAGKAETLGIKVDDLLEIRA